MGLFCKYLRVCCFRYMRSFLTLFPFRLLLSVCPHRILSLFLRVCASVLYFNFIVSLLYFNEVKLVSLYGSFAPLIYINLRMWFFHEIILVWIYFFLFLHEKNTNKLNLRNCDGEWDLRNGCEAKWTTHTEWKKRANCLHLFTETPVIRSFSTKIERLIRYKCVFVCVCAHIRIPFDFFVVLNASRCAYY